MLINGDCLEEMKNLPAKSVDLFVCDLPYGCLGAKEIKLKRVGEDAKFPSGKSMAGCSWDIKLDLGLFWEQIRRLRKNDHTPCLMFCNTRFGHDLINSNEKEFRYDLVWNKPNGVGFLSANKQPLRSHELIYVFAKKGAFYNRIDLTGDFLPYTKPIYENEGGSVYNLPKSHSRGKQAVIPSNVYNGGKPLPNTELVDNTGKRCVKSVIEPINYHGKIEGNVYDCADRKKPIERMEAREGIRCVKSVIEPINYHGLYGEKVVTHHTREGIRCVKSVIDAPNGRRKGQHPTAKPVELYKWLIERYSNEGDTVLDPTFGSGNSGLASTELKREYIGIEKDETFYNKFAMSINNGGVSNKDIPET